MRENDGFELLIDSALSDYADPGPQSGLEQRVLAHVLSAHAAAETAPVPRRRWLPWAIALPAAAVLLLLVLFLPWATHLQFGPALDAHQSQTPQIASAHASPQAPERTNVPGLHHQPRTTVLAVNSISLPKLDVFPTPQPLNPGEQNVAISTFQIPAPEFGAVLVAQQQEDAPLSIAAISIQPLEPLDHSGN